MPDTKGDSTIPLHHPVPQGWQEFRVGEVGEVRLGRQRSPQHERGRFMTPYLRVANVLDGSIDYSDVLSMNFTPREREIYGLRDGDILLNEGQSLELVGRCAIYAGPENTFCFQNTLIRYRCGPRLLPKFAFYTFKRWLPTRRFVLVARQTTSIAHLGADRFAGMTLLLPSLREQRSIVELLDSVDESIRSTERAVAKLSLIRTALLCNLLDPTAGGWSTVRLGDVADVAGGVALGRSLSGGGTVELPYLRVANVQDGYIDISDVKSIRVLRSEVARYSLRAGDFLMTEGGDFDKLGRGAIWAGWIEPCLHQNHIFRVRTDPSQLLPAYLAAYTASYEARRYFVAASKQTTNLATINITQVKALPIPLPPVTEQRSIIGSLTALDRRAQATASELAKLRTLKQGLMDDLLTGKVRINVGEEAAV